MPRCECFKSPCQCKWQSERPREGKPRTTAYGEKLKDPRWQKLRLQALDKAEWKCQDCDAQDKTLNVHHPYYIKGREPWEYPFGVMMVLCGDCHKKRHDEKPGEWFGNWEFIIAALAPSGRWEDVSCTIDYAESHGIDIASVVISALNAACAAQEAHA